MTGNMISIRSNIKDRSSKKIELFKVDRNYVLKPYFILLAEGFAAIHYVNIRSINIEELNRERLLHAQVNSVQLEIEGAVDNMNLFESIIIHAISIFFRDCDDYRRIPTSELACEQNDVVFINSMIDCFAIGWIAAIHEACLSKNNENVNSSMTPRQLLNELGIRILNAHQTTAICRGFEFGQVFVLRQQLNSQRDGAA